MIRNRTKNLRLTCQDCFSHVACNTGNMMIICLQENIFDIPYNETVYTSLQLLMTSSIKLSHFLGCMRFDLNKEKRQVRKVISDRIIQGVLKQSDHNTKIYNSDFCQYCILLHKFIQKDSRVTSLFS